MSRGKSARPRSIAIWDLDEGRTVRRFGPSWDELLDGFVQAQFEVSPDGSRSPRCRAGDAGVWDVASGQQTLRRPGGRAGLARRLEPGRDARDHGEPARLGEDPRSVRSRDPGPARGRRVRGLGCDVQPRRPIRGDGCRPHGNVPGLEPRTTIWDLERGAGRDARSWGAPAAGLAFSPDGCSHRHDGVDAPDLRHVWDVMTGARLAAARGRGDQRRFQSGRHPDRGGDGGRHRPAVRRDLGRSSCSSYGATADMVAFVDFSPDGSMLVSGAADGVVRVWALDIDDLLEIARREVTRSLTDEECQQYLHLGRCPD